MALQKQGFNLNFSKGLDTKSDPWQIPAGSFQALSNSVFGTTGLMQKRNGFPKITNVVGAKKLTTFNGNLVATGATLQSFIPEAAQWVTRSAVQPVEVNVQAVARSSASQTSPDTVVAANGLACTVFADSVLAGCYTITDTVTGSSVVGITQLAATATNPRVLLLGNFFVITFVATVGGSPHLRYVSVPLSTPTTSSAATDISTQISALSAGYDAVAVNNTLYIAWNGSDGGGAIRATFFNSSFVIGSSTVLATGKTATIMSVNSDVTFTTPRIWISFWSASTGYAIFVDQNLVQILAPTSFVTGETLTHLTGYSSGGVLTVAYQVTNTYSYNSIRTDLLKSNNIDSSTGTVTAQVIFSRNAGLASKIFILNGEYYVLASYGQALQPSYFLMTLGGNIVSKLAYSNGGGYNPSQVLSSVSATLFGTFNLAYAYKDLLVSVSTQTNVPGAATNLYTQTGANIATFTLLNAPQYSAEAADTLLLTGGQTWQYDGVQAVEQGFNVFPEDLGLTTATTGGGLIPQTYFYVATYEFTDASGNLQRSAPSVPLSIVVPAGTSTNTVTVSVPTLRLTYKNSVRVVIYRWSTAQQEYYQVTSIAAPLLSNKVTDSVSFVDTNNDASILGNTLLYTTGGVVENIGAPPSAASTLFKNRLFLLDAENRNLIWYSKQIIQGVPVEMSDLFTIYAAPTTGAQGSTGPATALSAMDDKLIIFKRDAIYYVVGTGPDNTGANNDFTDPVFITGAVGCANPNSIVLMPNGLMFQSDKGIWLLDRSLSTSYIGSPVQTYARGLVNSALTVPGTNQVRFTFNNNTALMYDYFEQQWDSFSQLEALSSTLYLGAQTLLTATGDVLQETPGTYLDNTKPVLMSFTTAWLKLTDLQGFQRVYSMYLLGNYITPHKLLVQVAYDYNPAIVQTDLIAPDNFSPAYGGDALYGSGTPYGGPSSLEQYRVFFQRQKCESIQITVTELYDPSYNVAAGAGLTISGLNFLVGAKSSTPKLTTAQSVG